MQPQSVETELFRNIEVALHFRRRRGRVHAVGIIALRQGEPLEHGLAVEQEPARRVFRATQAEITFDNVFSERQPHVVQPALARLPKVFFGKGDAKPVFKIGRSLRAADRPAAVKDFGFHRSPARRDRFYFHAGVCRVGIKTERADIFRGSVFEINALPYPRGARVETPERFPAGRLLAARQIEGNVVLRIDRNFVFTVRKNGGYVEGKRRISAAVRADENAVYVYFRLEIHGAETERHPPRPPFRGNGKTAPVPACADKIGVMHARKFRFGRKGHFYRRRQSVM